MANYKYTVTRVKSREATRMDGKKEITFTEFYDELVAEYEADAPRNGERLCDADEEGIYQVRVDPIGPGATFGTEFYPKQKLAKGKAVMVQENKAPHPV